MIKCFKTLFTVFVLEFPFVVLLTVNVCNDDVFPSKSENNARLKMTVFQQN